MHTNGMFVITSWYMEMDSRIHENNFRITNFIETTFR